MWRESLGDSSQEAKQGKCACMITEIREEGRKVIVSPREIPTRL